MRTGEFREWLGDMCCEGYVGLDDDYTNYEADWFANLDPEDVIEWAETWGKLRYLDGKIAGVDESTDRIKNR